MRYERVTSWVGSINSWCLDDLDSKNKIKSELPQKVGEKYLRG